MLKPHHESGHHRVAGLECPHPPCHRLIDFHIDAVQIYVTPCHLGGVLFGAFQASPTLEAKLSSLHRIAGGRVAAVLCRQSLGSRHCRCCLMGHSWLCWRRKPPPCCYHWRRVCTTGCVRKQSKGKEGPKDKWIISCMSLCSWPCPVGCRKPVVV